MGKTMTVKGAGASVTVIDEPGPPARRSLQATLVCDDSPGPDIVRPYDGPGGNTLCACPSNLNGNDAVDGSDLGLLLLAAWGSCGRSACAPGLNDDGGVTGAKLEALLTDRFNGE